MIPKKIHYCWFGSGEMPKSVEYCIASWKRFCEGYEIIRWDETNSAIKESTYALQAYQSKKWAFVSDYVRLKVLWEQGGIYLDTDVELIGPLEDLLEKESFCGFESCDKVATCLLAFQPKHPLIGELLKEYEGRCFWLKDGNVNCTTNVEYMTALLKKKGLVCNGAQQSIAGVTIYPIDWFSPKDLATGKITKTPSTRAIHHFNASWMSRRQRFHTRVAQCIGPVWTKRLKGMRKS